MLKMRNELMYKKFQIVEPKQARSEGFDRMRAWECRSFTRYLSSNL